MDSIPSGVLTGGGFTGVLMLLIVAFIKGWILIGPWVDRLLKDKDDEIAFLREANERLTSATQSFAVSTQTAAYALRAVEKQAEKAGDDK